MTSFFGSGIILIFLRQVEEDAYLAMRWVAVFHLPLFPLATLVVKPATRQFEYRGAFYGHSYDYEVLERYHHRPADILHVYMMGLLGLALALGPLIAWMIATKPWNQAGRAGDDNVVGVFAVVWLIAVVTFVDVRRHRFFNPPPEQ